MSRETYGSPQHWKVKFTTNVLIVLFLAAILVNSLVILGVQTWFVYDLDSPGAALADFSGAEVLDTAQGQRLRSWLLRDGETLRMVTAEKHIFLEQYRRVPGGTREISAIPYSKTVWGDNALVRLDIREDQFGQYNEMALSIQILRNGPRIPLSFLAWSVVLMALEIGVYCLVKKIQGR